MTLVMSPRAYKLRSVTMQRVMALHTERNRVVVAKGTASLHWSVTGIGSRPMEGPATVK